MTGGEEVIVLCRVAIFMLSILVLVACRATRTHDCAPRYLVTAAPLDVGGGIYGLCIAVEPSNPRGVWWWEPGRTGCSTRSTGPGVFPAEGAGVATRASSATIDARFRLPLIGSPVSAPAFANVN